MLDFASLAAQIQTLLDETPQRFDSRGAALDAARYACASCDRDGNFNATIRNTSYPDSWHPALLLDENASLCVAQSPPPAPPTHCVVASDGSQIYPDAHHISDCYLLNISSVALCYGDAAAANSEIPGNALLDATPQLFGFSSDDAWQEAARDSFINREFVDARRHVAELDELARLLENAPRPAIGLGDGIFDLRVSAAQSWRDWATSENERVLDRLRALGCPIGGYIAASRANDVTASLRVILRVAESSGPNRSNGDILPDPLGGLSDVHLFDALLKSGQRSAIFQTTRGAARGSQNASRGNAASGDSLRADTAPNDTTRSDTSRHATCFFYLKVDEGDVARLEFPIWVAERADWIELLHAIVLAQTEKGDGYPIALMEAHEHAVVRATDRDTFYALLEDAMLARGFAPRRSAKSRSKSRPLV